MAEKEDDESADLDEDVKGSDFSNVQSLAQGDDGVKKTAPKDTKKASKVGASSSAKDTKSATPASDDKAKAAAAEPTSDGGDGGGEVVKTKPEKDASTGDDKSADKKDAGKDEASSNGAKDEKAASDDKKAKDAKKASEDKKSKDDKKAGDDAAAAKEKKAAGDDKAKKTGADDKSKDKSADAKSADKKSEESSDMKPGSADKKDKKAKDSKSTDDDDSKDESKDEEDDDKKKEDDDKEKDEADEKKKDDSDEKKNKAVGSEAAGSPETPDEAGAAKTMTGVSSVQLTIENKDYAEELLHKLFKEHLVADATINANRVERLYMKYKKERSQDNVVKLHLVTADDRLPDLIRFLNKENPNSENVGVPDDIISTQMNGGSQEYITWVKEQTRSPELDKKDDTPKDDNDT